MCAFVQLADTYIRACQVAICKVRNAPQVVRRYRLEGLVVCANPGHGAQDLVQALCNQESMCGAGP